MGAIQGTINSIIGTVGGAIARGSAIEGQLSQQALNLEGAEFKAEGSVEKAQQTYNDVMKQASNIDKSGRVAKDKTTGKFLSNQTVGQVTHDVDRATKALQLAQRNLSAIQMQRASIEERMKYYGGKK